MAAQRHPWLLLRLHTIREELFAGLSCALEAHALIRNGASFSEHFYFLRRHSVPPSNKPGGWLETATEKFGVLPLRTRLLIEILVMVRLGTYYNSRAVRTQHAPHPATLVHISNVRVYVCARECVRACVRVCVCGCRL